jgi:DNA polymerase III epsilon subunit-like protein
MHIYQTLENIETNIFRATKKTRVTESGVVVVDRSEEDAEDVVALPQ